MWWNLDFQHHYCSLQCHMIFRNYSNILICCSRNISDYNQCWKQLCCTIFLWKPWCILFFRIHRWTESSKELHLFKIEILCNIINAFTYTFDQFNASLMNKCINFFKKKYIYIYIYILYIYIYLTDPKLVTLYVSIIVEWNWFHTGLWSVNPAELTDMHALTFSHQAVVVSAAGLFSHVPHTHWNTHTSNSTPEQIQTHLTSHSHTVLTDFLEKLRVL